jgi:hypothetical protein
MASITFNDGTSATLSNGLTATAAGVGSRFAAWVPFTNKVGEAATVLTTGARAMFVFRTDYGATFEMRDIPNTSLDVVMRLMRHLQGGGSCTVTTTDSASRVYTLCYLAPDASLTLSQADPQLLTYTLSLSLITLGAAADMLCVY